MMCFYFLKIMLLTKFIFVVTKCLPFFVYMFIIFKSKYM